MQTSPAVKIVEVCTVMGVQIAQKPFRLTDDYVAPKGALIMPSIVAANMQASSPSPSSRRSSLCMARYAYCQLLSFWLLVPMTLVCTCKGGKLLPLLTVRYTANIGRQAVPAPANLFPFPALIVLIAFPDLPQLERAMSLDAGRQWPD